MSSPTRVHTNRFSMCQVWLHSLRNAGQNGLTHKGASSVQNGMMSSSTLSSCCDSELVSHLIENAGEVARQYGKYMYNGVIIAGEGVALSYRGISSFGNAFRADPNFLLAFSLECLSRCSWSCFQPATAVFQTYGVVGSPSSTSWSRKLRDILFAVPHFVCGVGSIA